VIRMAIWRELSCPVFQCSACSKPVFDRAEDGSQGWALWVEKIGSRGREQDFRATHAGWCDRQVQTQLKASHPGSPVYSREIGKFVANLVKNTIEPPTDQTPVWG
jgi:hypothetical protein